MELHVWGDSKNQALIDAESLAATWYLSLTLKKDQFIIITSSNTDLSNSGKLPSLRDGDLIIDGYLDIIRYLSEEYIDLDLKLTKEQKALNKGLLYYIQDNLQIITDYTLYLNKSNYENYSRSIFKRYLPFPMQYNTPLNFRSNAKKNCERIGLTIEEKTEVEVEMLKQVPTVSKVQKLKNESMIEEKLLLKNSISNMKCLNQFKSIIETIENLKLELGSFSSTTIFHQLYSSDLLLLAYITIITNPELPDQFITSFINKLFPSLLIFKKDELNKLNGIDINIRGPYFSESPNLFNSIKHMII